MSTERRVLVIGAGASGLIAIKSCKEESLEVICYEKSKNFGGRWRYRENVVPGVASVMKSTVCISSKEMGAFSDFPPPIDFPNYMHHTKVLSYLTLYAQKFDLLRHIKYQREVVQVVPSSDYHNNGRWLVTSSNGCNKSQETEEFDCVMVCTGRFSQPVIPDFPDKSQFSGLMLHSQSLRNANAFENLKVLVVGNGNSAMDTAVEVSTVAKKVYLSTRSGFWVFPKVGPKGLPFDMFLLRRDLQFLKNMCGSVVNYYLEKYLETKTNHDINGIKPHHRALNKPPTVNDDVPDKILTGRIIIKGSILKFFENGVIFEHEDIPTKLDAVVFATGYSMTLPFLDCDFYLNSDGFPNLYKAVLPVNLEHPTLAFIGFVKTNGPQIPIYESQSRWASRIFAKKCQLPSTELINSYIKSNQSKTRESGNELMEDYIQYMDELAIEYGVKPDLCSLLFKDYSLFWACFSGPFLPYQYRLVGPHSLKEARQFILDCDQRVKEPLKTRTSVKISSKEDIKN